MDLCERIDEARERWNVLRHPFYTRWERGELTRDELGFYAGEYRHAVVALAETASAAGDAEHAREEAEHLALWDAFADACGSDPAQANAETAACVEAWTAGSDRLERLAVLYAIESAQPAIADVKYRGLVEHYGFELGPATDYFTVHSTLDHDHAASHRILLEPELERADHDDLIGAARDVLVGNWALLDGVERLATTA